MKKKILFLYCGGTIGQIPREVELNGVIHSVLFPPKDSSEFEDACRKVLTRVEEAADMDVVFELITAKDSSNMNPGDWETIAKRVQRAQDDESYDAVGIAHGTDTMAHTATALAFALHGDDPGRSGLQIPVVVMGAQNTIHVSGGDGEFNLHNLFRVIDKCIAYGVADVLVSFWSRVLLGCRAMKVSEKEFDAFRSPAYPDVGTVNSLGVTLRTDLLRKKSDASYSMSVLPQFSDDVMVVEITPGLKPENVECIVDNNQISAFILKSLGEGNVPIEGRYNFLPLIEKITKAEIPVIVSTRFIGGYVGKATYEAGLRAIEAGGIPGHDHTGVAAEVKARWLVGNGLCNSVDGFRKAYLTSYAGEVTL